MCNHSYWCIQLTKRMQIFFDTGAKFHEFPLWCGIAERIGWKPSPTLRIKTQHLKHYHFPYLNTFVSESAKHPNFTVYCDFCLHYLRAVICWGLKRNISFFFFSSSSASDSKEFAMEITSVNPDFLGESNHIQLCKNNIKLSAAVGLVKCKV